MDHQHTTGSSIVDRNLDRIVSLREAAHLSSLSEDTLKRRYPNIVRKLWPRRCGVGRRARHRARQQSHSFSLERQRQGTDLFGPLRFLHRRPKRLDRIQMLEGLRNVK